MPTVPGFVDDGDYKVAQQNGAAQISLPFLKFRDTKTFIAKVPMVVDVDYFQQPAPMTQRWFQNYGLGYLIDFDGPQQTPQRLMYYNLIYGNVPQTRTEYGSTTYKIQNADYDELGENARITSIVSTFDADMVYEYSIGTPLPQIFSNQLSISARGKIISIGNSTSVDSTTRKLAQNTTSRIYGGSIYERLSIFAKITLARNLIPE